MHLRPLRPGKSGAIGYLSNNRKGMHLKLLKTLRADFNETVRDIRFIVISRYYIKLLSRRGCGSFIPM